MLGKNQIKKTPIKGWKMLGKNQTEDDFQFKTPLWKSEVSYLKSNELFKFLKIGEGDSKRAS